MAHHWAEAGQRGGAASRGKPKSAEHRRKIGEAHRGRTLSDDHRRKISEARKGQSLSAEHRAKVGDAFRGKTLTDEHRAKISEANKGKVRSPEQRAVLSTAMRRDDPGYDGAHARVVHEKGLPSLCKQCGTVEGQFEWALSHDATDVRTGTSKRRLGQRYSPHVKDYVRLCVPCHRKYDGKPRRKKVTS